MSNTHTQQPIIKTHSDRRFLLQNIPENAQANIRGGLSETIVDSNDASSTHRSWGAAHVPIRVKVTHNP